MVHQAPKTVLSTRSCHKWEQDRVKQGIKYLACDGSWGTRAEREIGEGGQIFLAVGRKPLTQRPGEDGVERLGLCGWRRKYGPGVGRWGWYSQGAGRVEGALWGHQWLLYLVHSTHSRQAARDVTVTGEVKTIWAILLIQNIVISMSLQLAHSHFPRLKLFSHTGILHVSYLFLNVLIFWILSR